MKPTAPFLIAIAALLAAPRCASAAEATYALQKTVAIGGEGGFDYLYADSDARRLYIPRGSRIDVFDLDSLKMVGDIAGTKSVHGVAIDPASHHAFSSSQPVVMWDSRTLAPLGTVTVQGNPDGILFDPATSRIFVLSHRVPNVTVLDSGDGRVVGTIDLGGAPEEAASDGKGAVFIDVEDKDQVAVVDARTLKVKARYGLEGRGGGPGGLALDTEGRILFCYCHDPATAVIMNADNGNILDVLPIGRGVDAAEYDPARRQAISSQGDGTITLISETSSGHFAVGQTVATKAGARTSTLDAKTGRIFTVTAQWAKPTPAPSPKAGAAPAPGRGWSRRGPMLPGSFELLVVGPAAPRS
ncbi:MAG TPA: hypothetical protein VGG34_15505 [Opitutaceae bacterium]|jgi:DNA-binding beta-propeller fold protein YncE